MRITQNFLNDSVQFFLRRNTSRLFDAQETVATQKRINRVSDNPVDASRLLDIKGAKNRIEQSLRTILRVTSLANLHDTLLGQAEQLIVRAKELLLTEANEVTSTPDSREAARLEIASITSQLVQLGNTRFDGSYIFSGFSVDTPAFADTTVGVTQTAGTGGAVVSSATVEDTAIVSFADYEVRFTSPTAYDVVNVTTGATLSSGNAYTSGGSIRFDGLEIVISDGTGPPAGGDVFGVSITAAGVYQGDSGRQRVEVQTGTTIQQNMIGDEVFKDAGSGGIDIFAVLNDINTALRNDDRTAIEAGLERLDSARDQLSDQRATVGSRQNLLQTVLDRQEEIQFGLESLRSELEDADIIEAITRLNREQLALEATLATAARVVSVSLLDFLR